MRTWAGRKLPAMRSEAHFGDRIVRCFAVRPDSVDRMFRDSVARHGQRDAIVHESVRLSYEELGEAVARTAAGLRSAHIGRGDRVAMLIGNRAEFVVVLLAIQRLRAIAVPIGIREQSSGIAYVLQQCAARMLVHDVDLTARLPSPEEFAHTITYLSLEADPGSRWHRWHHPEPCTLAAAERQQPLEDTHAGPESEEDIAVILYTSGTTGQPKGALLSHLNIVHSSLHYEFCMQLSAEDRSAMAVPASHVTGLVGTIMAMLRVGGAIIIVSQFKALSFLELAAAQRITHTILVPSMYQLCLLAPGFSTHDLGRWRIGAYGGAPMPQSTIAMLARKLPSMTLMNAYGATETTSPATIMPAGLQADHLASVGRAVPAGDLKVMDDAGRELPAGSTGEIWICGPMVVSGYWENPHASAASFTAGYWRSGDIGSIDEAGFVRVFDRKKDMLNRGGFKIYSVEVENALIGFGGVLEAAIVGRPCDVLGERVHAVVSVEPSLAADPAATRCLLQEHCAALLADYKVPETWVIQTEPLPRNPNGKLMKRSLRTWELRPGAGNTRLSGQGSQAQGS